MKLGLLLLLILPNIIYSQSDNDCAADYGSVVGDSVCCGQTG